MQLALRLHVSKRRKLTKLSGKRATYMEVTAKIPWKHKKAVIYSCCNIMQMYMRKFMKTMLSPNEINRDEIFTASEHTLS